MKVNLGCGQAYLDGWVNVDEMPTVRADIYANAFDFIRRHGSEVRELYMGHFLEHLLPDEVTSLLHLIISRLPPGAQVSAVTPDIRAIFRAYEAGELDNETLNASFIYSYVQPSHHVWCFDTQSLLDAFKQAGMEAVAPVDPLTWPPVFHKEGPESRWQCGVVGTVPAVRVSSAITPSDVHEAENQNETLGSDGAVDLPRTPAEVLLVRVDRLRRQLEREHARTEHAENVSKAVHRQLDQLREELERAERDLHEVRLSRSYRIAHAVQEVANAALPKGSGRRRAAQLASSAARELTRSTAALRESWARSAAVADSVGSDANLAYEAWGGAAAPSSEQLLHQHHIAYHLSDPLRFLVIVDATERPDRFVDPIRTLQAQSWPHWDAIVLLPESSAGAVWDIGDPRVRPQPTEPDALRAHQNMVTSQMDLDDLVVFVRAGDLLAFDCLYEAGMAATQDPLVDLVYWDDDLRTPGGRRHSPRFRPEWSPEMLLGRNYIGETFAVRARRFMMFGGLDHDLAEGMWDLLLRAELHEQRVRRVPRVLLHILGERPEERRGRSAAAIVDRQLEARSWPAKAKASANGPVHIAWDLPSWPKVSVIIPTRHNRAMLERSLPSVEASDYPDFEVIVIDNGERTEENEAYYTRPFRVPLHVEWWNRPFNYSAVNNLGARLASGDVFIFLNDDTEATDPNWLKELVGWATRPEIGVVGPQLLGLDGRVQFAGTVLGLNGFAEHAFAGMSPKDDSLFGSVANYRNVLAVTGACLGIARRRFEEIGGFDERFILCGSDVAMGLDTKLAGYRNVCTPFAPLVHLESATRGTDVPEPDFYASFWRYQSWLFGGDPYFSPNLSLLHRVPTLRSPDEPTVQEMIAPALKRSFAVFRQRADAEEAQAYADSCRASEADVRAIRALHESNRELFEPESVNWFIPDLDSPFYGGINTALRIADHLAQNHGVANRFVVWGPGPVEYVRSGIAAAFPAIADSEVVLHDGRLGASLERVPEADVSIATLWVTAYQLAHFHGTRRKFYLVQDFEPVFNPAGTLYALAEESYRLGMYGLCNTEVMRHIYEEEYGGVAHSFVPAVDPSVFHANGRPAPDPDRPVTIFVYARAGHWRNCWELASLALRDLKERMGDRVRIVAAGSWARPDGSDLDPIVKHVGLLDYRATGELYRQSDIGLALTVSKHPSYLPIELMACGVPVVAFDSPNFHWLLRDGENCLLAPRTVDGVADALERLAVDAGLRRRLSKQGLVDIAARHGSWDKALAGVYGFLSDPEGASRGVG